jgi:hypothetical protein
VRSFVVTVDTLGQRAMKTEEWKTYRTRFLVKAKQLSSNLSFIDPLGRQHSGRRGDYLVESSDGVISIAPRQIFEDIYVPMLVDGENSTVVSSEPIPQEQAEGEPIPGPRKLPQSCRERRGTNSSIGFL